MSLKILAFYLPQFHSIPENDEWWGKGFTEWERLKTAKSVFKGHNQPRIPYEYYDLSDVNVMVKQAALAKEYGIYGFCYYHYWFNGHKLLHKPLENMLAEKRVDIPFCLSWANEPWTRAWAGNSKEILMPQEYGDTKEWEEHLNYLIPFFMDERYIKIDGKPLFLIYRTESFNRFDEMIEFWNKKLQEQGLSGLYIAEMLTSFQKRPFCKNSEAVVEFEPMFTISGLKTKFELLKRILRRKLNRFLIRKYASFNYEKVTKKIIKRQLKFDGKTTFLGAFPDWDNTPRFKEKGTVFKNATPENFGKLLKAQICKSESEFLFINAWNEWTEGAYLEPDFGNNDKILKEIKNIYGY